MAEITAAAVKALRQQTGLPMMDCKKALQEAGGDSVKAVDLLRKTGAKLMEKRAGRATTFGRIVLPLLKPGLIAGWIYIVIVSIRELASSILLYSPGTEVVSVTIWEMWQNGQYVELSALGVMMILVLFCFVMLAEFFGRRFGVVEA